MKLCETKGCPTNRAAVIELISAAHAEREPVLVMPTAVARVRWPGSDPIDMCAGCAAWARKVAETLGFVLDERRVEPDLDEGTSRVSLIEVD